MARKSKAEMEFWKKIHPTCKKCIHECKQSSKVELISCEKKNLKKKPKKKLKKKKKKKPL